MDPEGKLAVEERNGRKKIDDKSSSNAQGKMSEALLCSRLCTIHGSKDSKHWMFVSVVLNVIFALVLIFRKDTGFSTLSLENSFKVVPRKSVDLENKLICEDNESPDRQKVYKDNLSYGGANFGECYSYFADENCLNIASDRIINLDHGDPTMFAAYWHAVGGASTTVILGWQRMSYFANKQLFWFVEQELEREIRSLHKVVGNAVTEGRHIVIGTGSTQLFQAALYALAPPDRSKPASVVSASPFYSSYPLITDYLKSEIYRWAGDAMSFQPQSPNDAYIELVTSPNNPDGTTRHPVVNGTGPVVYDLAYYWPHYTPIIAAADHDLMLFTVSKSTGHAGTRIGWAIVKDVEVAKRMAKFVELNTIGVSQDAQIRATHILRTVVNAYAQKGSSPYALDRREGLDRNKLFHYGYSVMEYRWRQLQAAVSGGDRFSVPHFPPEFCSFFGEMITPHPAFAWLRCNKESDCHGVLKAEGILTRSGLHFGANSEYVRVSMLDQHSSFNIFLNRMKALSSVEVRTALVTQ
ncbi:hypothetical protein O6H91_Y536600 [Diphasiastrum complanatum]|nr:hypothetical protein O6H91_Y536600 [Diphasiastrum complanatum]KAJ7186330.1 hypothetical protein O6H91_Y536600 [Diphasiastrum complanatum]